MLLGVALVQWTNDAKTQFVANGGVKIRAYTRKFNARVSEPKALFAAMKEGAVYRYHLEHSQIMVVSETQIDLSTLTSEFKKHPKLVGFHDKDNEEVWAQLMDGLNRKACIDELVAPKLEHLAEVRAYIDDLDDGTLEYEEAKYLESKVEEDIAESSQWLVRFYSYGMCSIILKGYQLMT